MRIEFTKKEYDEGNNQKQSKIFSNGNDKSYTNSYSYTFIQNELLMDKPNYLGFAVLEFSKLPRNESYFYKLEPWFGEKKIQLQYMVTDSFV